MKKRKELFTAAEARELIQGFIAHFAELSRIANALEGIRSELHVLNALYASLRAANEEAETHA